jgi:hypothetical protein
MEFLFWLVPYLALNRIMILHVNREISAWRSEQYSLALFPLWIRAVFSTLVPAAASVRGHAKLRQNNRSMIDAVLTWGVNVESSWLRPPDQPLLFSDYRPRPASWAVVNAASR